MIFGYCRSGFVFALALLLPVSACSQNPITKTVHWLEQVKLQDNRVIVAEREQRYRFHGAPGFSSPWSFEDATVRTASGTLASQNLIWHGKGSPIALDIARDGSVYLVMVLTRKGREELADGRQYPTHIAFRAVSGSWTRIPVEVVPPEIQPNLLLNTYRLFITEGWPSGQTIDLVTKDKVNSDPRIAREILQWSK